MGCTWTNEAKGWKVVLIFSCGGCHWKKQYLTLSESNSVIIPLKNNARVKHSVKLVCYNKLTNYTILYS